MQAMYVTGVRNKKTAYNIHLAKPAEGLVKKPNCTRRIILKHALEKKMCKYRIEIVDPEKISIGRIVSFFEQGDGPLIALEAVIF